jgi:hypothetical protein
LLDVFRWCWTARVYHNVSCFRLRVISWHVHNDMSVYSDHWLDNGYFTVHITIMILVHRWTYNWRTFLIHTIPLLPIKPVYTFLYGGMIALVTDNSLCKTLKREFGDY